MHRTSVRRTIVALSLVGASSGACAPAEEEPQEATTQAVTESISPGGKTCSTKDGLPDGFPEGLYICKYGISSIALNAKANHFQYFVVGADNSVWTAWEYVHCLPGTDICILNYSDWHDLGGKVYSTIGVTKDADGNIYLKATGGDGHPWCLERFPSGKWNYWWRCG